MKSNFKIRKGSQLWGYCRWDIYFGDIRINFLYSRAEARVHLKRLKEEEKKFYG